MFYLVHLCKGSFFFVYDILTALSVHMRLEDCKTILYNFLVLTNSEHALFESC